MKFPRFTDCKHVDNWGYCRIKKAPWWFRFLAPEGRARCIMDIGGMLQDGVLECALQEVLPRPDPPLPFLRAKKPLQGPGTEDNPLGIDCSTLPQEPSVKVRRMEFGVKYCGWNDNGTRSRCLYMDCKRSGPCIKVGGS